MALCPACADPQTSELLQKKTTSTLCLRLLNVYPTENDQWNFTEIPVEFQWNISPEFLWNSTEIPI